MKNDNILYNECIQKQKVMDLVKICEENNIYYTLNTEKYILAKKLNYNLLYYHYENSKKSDSKKTSINIVENIEKYIIENDIGEVTKITISDENKSVFKGIIKKISSISGINVLEVSNMSRKNIKSGTEENEIHYYYTEITKENVNKWTALEMLAKHLKIEKQEIATIGDNVNDLEMIKNAGIGIVMGKSSLETKNLGKPVVKSNDLCRSSRSNREIYIKTISYKNITKIKQLCYIWQKYCIIMWFIV